MKTNHLIDKINEIDDSYILESIAYKEDRKLQRLTSYILRIAASFAIIFLILPNISPSVAQAMERLPVIGPLVKVITIREYIYDDTHNQAHVKYPKTSDALFATETEANNLSTETERLKDTSTAFADVNAATKKYIDTLVAQFKSDIASTNEGYSGLDVSYQIVTDTNSWFTLQVSAVITKADGNEQIRYYNVNKQTGKIVAIKDLFPKDYDYIKEISNDIKSQMKAQMQKDTETMYFMSDVPNDKGDFYEISPDTDYFFDKNGNLTITFSEACVAPAYYGPVSFSIGSSVTSHLIQKPD